MSDNNLPLRGLRPKPQHLPLLPCSSADDVSSLNRTSSESSSDESPSGSPPPPVPKDKEPSIHSHSSKNSQHSNSRLDYAHRQLPPTPTEKPLPPIPKHSPPIYQNNSRGNQCEEADMSGPKSEGGGDSTAASTGNRKDSSCQTEKSYVNKGSRISDFEKEIKKLLDRQKLPPVDELASVQKVLSVMDKIRYLAS